MISLRDTQRAFCSAVLSGDMNCMASLVRGEDVPSEQRMQIYSNSNRLGFLAAMQATYPVIERLGGEQWFEQRARQYQLRFPSRSGDLQHVGAHFAEFLQAELSDTQYEYFSDVAQLEWAYQEVLTAAESVALDPAALSAIAADDYEHLVFVPRPALRLVESRYPILAIWKAHQPGTDLVDINLASGPSRILLIRCIDHVELRELSAAGFALLEQFTQGTFFGAAVEAVEASHAEFDLSASLRQLVSLECFAGFRLRNSSSVSTASNPPSESRP